MRTNHMPRLAATTLAIALAAAIGAPAHAAGKPPRSELEEAREHYLAGTRYFDLTKYDEAIREFSLAYEAKPDPAFLFNIAQAHRLAGHLEKAERFYRNYLRLVPASPERPEIERRIAEIEQALRTQQGQQALPPMGTIEPGESARPPAPPPVREPAPVATPTPTPAPVVTREPATDRGRVPRIAGLVTAAAGVALVGVGLGLGIDSLAARERYAHPAPGQVYDPSLEQRANVNDIVAIGVGVAGLAAVTAGLVLYLEGRRSGHGGEGHAALVPVVGPTRAGAEFSLSF